MIQFSIPQDIIDNLIVKLSEIDPSYDDDTTEAYAKYDDDHWLIDCVLKYSTEWSETTEGDGRPVYMSRTEPQEFVVLNCEYYPDPKDTENYIDYKEQLLNQLNETL